MAGRLYIPKQVQASIILHIKDAISRTTSSFESGAEEEDTMTGMLGANLMQKNVTVQVTNDEINGPWKWSLIFSKFRGRGPDATETNLGADGIFEICVDRGGRIDKKSLLFQSKIMWENDPNLLEQGIKMSTWREAALLIDYRPDKFAAYSIDDLIRSHGTRDKQTSERAKDLEVVLGNDFVECRIGDTELDYDARRRELRWRTSTDDIVTTKFSIPNRMKVLVTPPKYDRLRSKEISHTEIHNHRMKASSREILSVRYDASESELKKARRDLALAYHSDLTDNVSEISKAILNRRMQELNNAYEELNRDEKLRRERRAD